MLSQTAINTLRAFLDETTNRIIAEVIHGDSSEATEVAAPRQLSSGRTEGN